MKNSEYERARIIPELFILSRKLEEQSNKSFIKDDITMKQWLVLISISQQGASSSLSKIASDLNMSHQNVKQIALHLEKNGYITLKKDEKDKRKILLATTKKTNDLWIKRSTLDRKNIDEFLRPLTLEESILFSRFLHMLLENIEKMNVSI